MISWYTNDHPTFPKYTKDHIPKIIYPSSFPNIALYAYRNSPFSSVQFSRSVVSNSLRPHELQHARPPCPSPTPGVHSDSRPSSLHPYKFPNSWVKKNTCENISETLIYKYLTIHTLSMPVWNLNFLQIQDSPLHILTKTQLALKHKHPQTKPAYTLGYISDFTSQLNGYRPHLNLQTNHDLTSDYKLMSITTFSKVSPIVDKSAVWIYVLMFSHWKEDTREMIKM